MLKYQVRTLGRERQRQSTTPLRDVFPATNSSTDSSPGSGPSGNVGSAPNSPWHDLSRARGRSTSVSSLSSASTSSAESGQELSTIRVYTSSVRPDTDYKTLFANANTTAAELIRQVLNKFRSHFKDTELFYLVMELTTKHETSVVRHAVALDSGAKPLVLQSCYPSDRCRFVLQIRQSFPVRIYDSSFCTTSNYKTLLVSQWTTCAEVIRMVMKTGLGQHLDGRRNFEESQYSVADFGIALVDARTTKEVMLRPTERIFTALHEMDVSGQCQLHLRPLRRCQPLEFDEVPLPIEHLRRRKTTSASLLSFVDDENADGSLVARVRDLVL